jgi:hypothetical protein
MTLMVLIEPFRFWICVYIGPSKQEAVAAIQILGYLRMTCFSKYNFRSI